MAFTGGIPTKKTSSGNNTQSLQQNSYDRIVEVTGYDTTKGYIYAKDDKKEYEVYVNAEVVRRSEESSRIKGVATLNFQGHNVDERMQKHNPPGSKLILSRSKIIKKDNGQGKSLVEAQWIAGVPNPEPDKTFQGIVSVTYSNRDGKKKVNRAYVWDKNAIDIGDEESIEKLKQEIDRANEENQKVIKGYKGEYRVTVPTVGVQFRALQKTDRTYSVDGSPVYEAVNTSVLFSWMPGPPDENGKSIQAQSHNMTGDEMLQFVGLYVDYIQEHELFKDNLQNMTVEICPFKVYPVSQNTAMLLSTERPENDDKNPLYQMAHRRNFLDIEQSEQIEGQNNAVNGIIQCGPDKSDKDKATNQPVFVPQYWVSKIHANNTRGHVHAFVRTSQGNKVEPHDNLQLIKTAYAQNVNRAAENAPVRHESSAPVQQPTKAANVNPETLTGDDPFGGDDFLGDDPFDPLSAPPSAAEPVNTTPVKPTGVKFGLGLKKS